MSTWRLRLDTPRLVLLALLALPVRVHAAGEEADTRTARVHFQRAETDYDQGRFDEALAGYEAAYQARPLPAFLFNVAQCHRKLGNHDRALVFYRRYLELDPRTPNRPLVEQLIAESERRGTSPPASPPAREVVRRPRAGSSPVVGGPPRPAVVPPPVLVAMPPPEASERRPLYRRWWVWAAGGAVVFGAATVLMLSRGPGARGPAGDLGAIDWH